MLQQGSGRDELEVSVHFAHGDEEPESWYSSVNLPILKKLKDVYDLTGLFSWYNPVVGREEY